MLLSRDRLDGGRLDGGIGLDWWDLESLAPIISTLISYTKILILKSLLFVSEITHGPWAADPIQRCDESAHHCGALHDAILLLGASVVAGAVARKRGGGLEGVQAH